MEIVPRAILFGMQTFAAESTLVSSAAGTAPRNVETEGAEENRSYRETQ